MNKTARFLLMAALVAAPVLSFAQNVRTMTNSQLSDYYKQEISAIEDEIKANKKRQKVNPADTQLKAEEQQKRELVDRMKAQRRAVEEAVEAEKNSVRAQRRMHETSEAAKQAERRRNASKQAVDLVLKGVQFSGSYEQLSNQYKHEIDAINDEIKAIKKRLKLNPADQALKLEEQQKNMLIEQTKARKKAIDTYLKDEQDYKRAQEKAQQAQREAEALLKEAKEKAAMADRMVGRTEDKK